MPVSAGTAYVDIKGDFASLNKQIAGQQGVLGGKFGKIGKVAGGALVGGLAAAGIGKALYSVGKSFDDAYDTIRVGTGKTGKQLEGLKGDFKSVVKGVPASFKDASTAVADLNTRLGLTGKPLQDRAKQFLELSRITKTDVSTNIRTVTRAFGDWEVKTKDQAGTLDKFFRAAQSSGATVEQLADQVVKFGAPLRQVGFSLDEATAMFAAFEKAGVNTQTMMPGLKMALKTFMTEGVDPKKGLEKTFKGIKDGTINAAEAMKIFGTRAGPDMVEAIQQGRFELGAMTKALQNGKDTIRGAGKDTMSFAEHWLMFKNKVLVKLEPIAIRVFDGMGKLMVVLPPIAAKVGAAVGALLGPFIAVGKAIAGNKTATVALAAAAGVLLSAWAGFAIVGAIRTAIGGMVTAFWALNAAMAANPIGLVVVALAALVAAFVVAYRESETFRAIIDAAFKVVKKIVLGTLGAIAAAIKTAWAVVSAITSTAWNAVKAYFTAVWSAIRLVVTTYVNSVRSILTAAWSALRSATSAAWNAIRDAVLGPIRAVRDLIGSVVTGIANRLSAGWTTITSAATTAWQTVRDRILGPVRAARDAIGAVIEGIANRAQAGWNTIIKGVSGFASSVKEKIVGAFEGAVAAVKGFINQIIGAINAIPGVPNIKKLAEGGTLGGPNGTGRLQALARGGIVNRPMAIVGEEAPRHKEYVIPTNPAYRSRALELFGALGKQLGIEGFAKGGIIGNAISKVGGVLGKGAKFFLDKLPGVGDLPDWLKGTGKHVLDSVGKWIKDKVGSLIKAAAKLAGVGGGSGAGTMSGTNAKAAKLAQMFGATITSGYRDPAHNASVGGVAGSSHTKGTPANPGAHDFVPASQALLAAALKMGAKWVDNHDFGSGLHSHVSWFRKGGVLGSYANGTSYVPQTGVYGLHRGEAVIDAKTNAAGAPIIHVHFSDPRLKDLIHFELERDGRRQAAEFRAGVA